MSAVLRRVFRAILPGSIDVRHSLCHDLFQAEACPPGPFRLRQTGR